MLILCMRNRPGYGQFDVNDIDPFLCTHGYYGFADMSNETFKVYPYDPWYDLAPGECQEEIYCCQEGYCNYDSYRRFVALKEINPNFIPMLTIGGWNAGTEKYSIMAADPAKRNTFITSVINILEAYGFEGVDFGLVYPGVMPGEDVEHIKENYAILVKEMSERLKENNLCFTGYFNCGKISWKGHDF